MDFPDYGCGNYLNEFQRRLKKNSRFIDDDYTSYEKALFSVNKTYLYWYTFAIPLCVFI